MVLSKAFKTIGLLTAGSLATLGAIQIWEPQLINHDWKFSPISNNINQKQNVEVTKQKNLSTILPLNDFELNEAVDKSLAKLSLWKTVNTIPGFVIGVSIRGQTVWTHGEGYADIENALPCKTENVMRIGSISKSITAALLAKMVQEKKIDLDKSIHHYLTKEQFPQKHWEGQPVDITLRQLVSHLGGIRHYKIESTDEKKNKPNTNGDNNGEFTKKEIFLQKKFPTVIDSLTLFKDDPLVAKPGTKYVYTTFGWTLISAVMETQMEKKDFTKNFIRFLHQELGLLNTFLDEIDPIIFNRARYYCRDLKTGKIKNVPYVDNSYKWAGGGLVSNVTDLLKFGNIMLYSFKGVDHDGKSGYLQQSLVDEMWRPAPNTNVETNPDRSGYGIGWVVVRDKKSTKAFAAEPKFPTIFYHTGSAVGASSVLLIEPERELVVVLITNLQEAYGIYRIGLDVAKQFETQLSKQIEK